MFYEHLYSSLFSPFAKLRLRQLADPCLPHSPPLALTPSTKKPRFRVASLLTHLGSNQDSAEPKSDVLPITPWVSSLSFDAAKLNKFFDCASNSRDQLFFIFLFRSD